MDIKRNLLNSITYFRSDLLSTVSYVVLVAPLVFIMFVYLSEPLTGYSFLSSGYITQSFTYLLSVMIVDSGYIGVGLTILYSIVFSLLLKVLVSQYNHNSVNSKGLFSIVPVLLVSGCSSCGVGVVSIISSIGFFSVSSILGNGILLFGILVTVATMIYIGDPKTCQV